MRYRISHGTEGIRGTTGSYWERENYIGFGPSAHSFDQRTRRWKRFKLEKNISMRVEHEGLFGKMKVLTPQDQ
jgi:oxygen-independent coproporphyrinogen-3 oxidase